MEKVKARQQQLQLLEEARDQLEQEMEDVEDAEDALDNNTIDDEEEEIPTVMMHQPYKEPIKNHKKKDSWDDYDNDISKGPKGKARNGEGKKSKSSVNDNNDERETEEVDVAPPEDTLLSLKKFFGWRRSKKNRRSDSPETRSSVVDGSVSQTTPSVRGRTYHEVLV